MEIKKVLATKGGKKFYVRDLDKDMHTQYGYIKSDDIKKSKDGDILKTNTDKELSIFTPSFIDIYNKIKRGAQIIPLKDIAAIIAEVGLQSNWKVVDAGSGSGALSCFLAHIVNKGKVHTYDIREDHIKIVKKNIETLELTNIECENHNIYESVPQKNVDLITLDVPEPWEVLKHANGSLKIGGYLVAYTPSVPQMADFVNTISEGLIHIKSIEIIEREWEVVGRKVRPKTASIGHSGFLTFVRRIS